MSKLIIGAVVLIVIAAGGYFLLSGQNQTQTPQSVTPTVVPSESMEASPSEAPEDAMESEASSIELTDSGFSPKALTVKVGTEVTWTNNNGKVATVHSAPHPAHTTYPPLNLGQFDDGESLSLTFDKAGTYFYHNHLDTSQNGSVVVE